MRFDASDRADGGQVDDRRGRSGLVLGAGAGGLGLVGTLVYLAIQWLGGNVDVGSTQPTSGDYKVAPQGPAPTPIGESCEGVTSSSDPGTFIACVQNNVQLFWQKELAKGPRPYTPAKLVLFEAATESGCGSASARTGPFYCPLDHRVYLDLGFFGELKQRFRAKGGDFAEAYVVAHEYGHHVQSVLGTERAFRDAASRTPAARANALSVKLELQADCYAGVWGHHAYAKGKVSTEEIAQALDAAAAIGDDRIQQEVRGRVSPEKFTHGSSAERQRWFRVGMDGGDPAACDTFGGDVR